MRRILAVLVVLFPASAWAQNPPLSTRANDTLRRMFTQVGSFGPPGYATDPFACTAQTKRTIYYKTADNLIYYCNGTAWGAIGGGVGLGGTNAWTGTNSFIDGNFSIIGSADATKIAKFEVDGFTTGNTRIFTLPGLTGNGTLMDLATAQTATAVKTFDQLTLSVGAPMKIGGAGNTFPSITHWSPQTPDQGGLLTGSIGNAWIIAEASDFGTDGALPQQTNPTLAIFGATYASGTQVMLLRHNQTQGQVVDGSATAANARPIGFMGGSAVASAATITPTGNVFHVTGTTNITAGMTVMAAGTCVTMIFDGVLTISDIAAFNIGAAYTTSADDTLTMCSDGTNWIEASRSVN